MRNQQKSVASWQIELLTVAVSIETCSGHTESCRTVTVPGRFYCSVLLPTVILVQKKTPHVIDLEGDPPLPELYITVSGGLIHKLWCMIRYVYTVQLWTAFSYIAGHEQIGSCSKTVFLIFFIIFFYFFWEVAFIGFRVRHMYRAWKFTLKATIVVVRASIFDPKAGAIFLWGTSRYLRSVAIVRISHFSEANTFPCTRIAFGPDLNVKKSLKKRKEKKQGQCFYSIRSLGEWNCFIPSNGLCFTVSLLKQKY